MFQHNEKKFFFNDWMLDCTNRVNVVEQQALVKEGKLQTKMGQPV